MVEDVLLRQSTSPSAFSIFLPFDPTMPTESINQKEVFYV